MQPIHTHFAARHLAQRQQLLLRWALGGWRMGLLALLAGLLLALTLPAAGATAAPVVLSPGQESVALDAALQVLQDASGQLSVEQVEAMPGTAFASAGRFKTYSAEAGTLWLGFDAVLAEPAQRWWLTVPLAGVDSARLHRRGAGGQWVSQQAGDVFAMATWPQPGRYPVFALKHAGSTLDGPKTQRYWLEIHHARVPFSVMPHIVSDAAYSANLQRDSMLLGIYFGLAALVTVLALVNAVVYRDMGFVSYALYMALFAGAQASLTGVSSLFAWPGLPVLNNIGVFFLPVAACAAAIWFARTITTPRRFSRALDWFMLGLMGLLPLVGLMDAVFPTLQSFAILNTLISASMLMLLMAVVVAVVEGDRHARWIALGFLPVLLATAFPLLRNFGVLSTGFLSEHGMMLASSLEAPILFFGLLRRAAQRREARGRAKALRTTDPLTGLLSKTAVLGKLRQTLGTAGRYPQPFALLVVNLVNWGALQRAQHGREAGDRAMVMAASRIRGAARPADSVARVGDHQFALLMQGPVSADAANSVATQILASGLRPSHDLPDGEPLKFHIAVGHVDASSRITPEAAAACLSQMQAHANALNDGSPKAIKRVLL